MTIPLPQKANVQFSRMRKILLRNFLHSLLGVIIFLGLASQTFGLCISSKTFLTGSVIIDMRVKSQSMGKELKSIGLTQADFLVNSSVARYHETLKANDRIDFIQESRQLTEDPFTGILFTSPEIRQTTISLRINTRKDKV